MRLGKLLGQQHRLADKGQLAEGIGHAVKGIQAHESCFNNLPTLTEDHFLAFRRGKSLRHFRQFAQFIHAVQCNTGVIAFDVGFQHHENGNAQKDSQNIQRAAQLPLVVFFPCIAPPRRMAQHNRHGQPYEHVPRLLQPVVKDLMPSCHQQSRHRADTHKVQGRPGCSQHPARIAPEQIRKPPQHQKRTGYAQHDGQFHKVVMHIERNGP